MQGAGGQDGRRKRGDRERDALRMGAAQGAGKREKPRGRGLGAVYRHGVRFPKRGYKAGEWTQQKNSPAILLE